MHRHTYSFGSIDIHVLDSKSLARTQREAPARGTGSRKRMAPTMPEGEPRDDACGGAVRALRGHELLYCVGDDMYTPLNA